MDTAIPPAIDSDSRARRKYYLEETPQRRALMSLLRAVFYGIMKMEILGSENLPREGAGIVAANHVTNFDVFPMQFSLPRPIFFMGKAELFKNPIMDLALRNLGAFPVTRGDKDMWAMRHASKVLKQGQWLGMFPEGTRSKGKGLTVAKTGTARMAIEAGCPILPMAIIGTDKFFKQFPRRAHVNVSILPPLTPMENESPLALTDRLMFTLAQALPISMRGVYASLPEGFG
ncbi:MAG TPA: lysophospholipid acyltransferase family protein [Anaerolineales bacterium]|jgi:1-acyl-sn-glycerol-3-phosphate acyltransferase|nr:lysophospholipid acyltransferase family protein [Anaerolineales bacterium]